MRQMFAHDALVDMHPDADMQAPGAAITVALCGRGDHRPHRPFAAHHTHADREGRGVRLRILFATDPEREHTVRRRLEAALATGRLHSPDGSLTRWQLRSSQRGQLAAGEAADADGLTRD